LFFEACALVLRRDEEEEGAEKRQGGGEEQTYADHLGACGRVDGVAYPAIGAGSDQVFPLDFLIKLYRPLLGKMV
jgi:hypothetical protein